MGIESISIKNFKSVQDSGEVKIERLNILIGPNGVGKSNFISFFKFLSKLYQQELQLYVSQNGRADNFLYFGVKKSQTLEGRISFDNEWKNEYEFVLVVDQQGNFVFKEEYSNTTKPNTNGKNSLSIGEPGSRESQLKSNTWFRTKYLREHLQQFKIFHFHDTSFNSSMKQACSATDYAYLREDGGNIAAFLYRLSKSERASFLLIEKIIQSIAPFFDGFYLQPDEISPEQIFLRWKEKGSDKLFTAHNLSDGTLRMICLTTLLLQPTPPATIIIDEPELGLHPSAISKLAAMLQSAANKSQIIISTQSVNLVSEFSANDIIVVERKDNQTVFNRQSEESLSVWLEDYSLGQLWEKNILGGRP